MKIKTIRQAKKINNQIVFLRADFNVPMKDGKIEDDYKIVVILPTIRFLLRHGCKIVIATHLGKPNGQDKKLSVKPIADRLSQLLDKKIKLVDKYWGRPTDELKADLNKNNILILENLRFCEGEKNNDKKFARLLASMAQLYVNDAFAVSHRRHASVSAIKKYLPSYAGLLLTEEIENLNKILKPQKPMVSVVGGDKTETKIKLVGSLSKKSFMVLVGGALANNFIAAHGFEVGKSFINPTYVKLAKKFKDKNIILPIDVLVGKNKEATEAQAKSISQVGKEDVILDIGPRTIKLFSDYIRKANTIVWNGPMGYSENKCFKHGTMAMAQVFASRSRGPAFGVVGGGETVAALNQAKMIDDIDWVSTGGGAMLAYLSGEKMPGLKGIIK